MVFAFFKNAIWPASPTKRSRRNYGTIKDIPEDETISPPSPTAFSDADTDVEGQQLIGEESSTGVDREWKLNPRIISDAIIGLSDGLTVPFALTAGLSGLGDTRVVVLGGLAELIAGAISMGLGGFIGAKSEAESYNATLYSTRTLIRTSPTQTNGLVHKVFSPYHLSSEHTDAISRSLHETPDELLDFLMRFHHQQAEPETSRPLVSAATIAGGYFIGGFVPLLPYFFVSRSEVLLALWWSVAVMIVALFSFGWVKTGVVCGWTGTSNVWMATKSGLQMVVVGGVAAGAAVGLVRVINGS